MPRREPRRLRRERHRRLSRRGRSYVSLRLRAGTVALLFACACGGEGSRPADGTSADAPLDGGGQDTLVDAAGVPHVLPEPASRIVSLVPSATITLRALGAEGALVGRTDYDTAAWAASVPSVGGGLDPNLEAIIALDPDVVIRFEGEQDPRTPARLDQLGIPHVAVRPVSLEQIFTTTDIVGRLTGREARADSLARSIRSGLAAIETRVAELPLRRVAYVLGGSPPWVSGPDTYIDEILALVGAVNVFDDLEAPYTAVSPEELRTRDIDVVLVSHDGTFEGDLAPEARVEVIGTGLENPGPGVVEAAWTVAEAIHGRSLR
jgi:iron complex transport system substrate-binding protein